MANGSVEELREYSVVGVALRERGTRIGGGRGGGAGMGALMTSLNGLEIGEE